MNKDKYSILHILIAGIGFIFVLALAATIALAGMGMYRQGLRETEDKARILMDRNLATHIYFSRVMKPRLMEWTAPYSTKEYFEPSWMSSTYALHEIHKYFGEINPFGYYIKDAAIHARSRENEADALERSFLEQLKADPAPEGRSAVVTIEGKPYFVYLRKGEVMEESCLLCHGRPEDAPGGLVEKYGPVRSFGRNVGDPISAISVRIPFSFVYAGIRETVLSLTVLLVVCLGVIFAFQYHLYRKYLIEPIYAIRDKAAEISRQEDRLGEQIPPLPGRELNELAQAFNDMSLKLRAERDSLEDQVRNRTRALFEVNEQLTRDAALRIEAEREVGCSRDRLRALAERLQGVREETMTNTAYEIHDDLGGNLAGLKMDLSHLETKVLEISDPEQRKALLGGIGASKDLIDRSVFALRRIMMGLRPIILDDFGLAAAVEWQAAEFTRNTGVPVDSRLDPLPEEPDPKVSTAVFRIFQEALTNVTRHAGASRVSVRLHADGEAIVLEVRDNGRGIMEHETADPNSLGILGMSERAAAFGGEIRIEGEPGKGTTLTLHMPVLQEGGQP
jgi:hypothetical protein